MALRSVAIFYNIRSAYNVGSMFRTADAAGVTKIYLVGHTPAPLDRFGRFRKDIAKAALGAEKTIPWEYEKEILPLLTKLKKENCQIIAIEQSEKSLDYKKVKIKAECAFIVGNEVTGLPKEVLEVADVIAEIPMNGKKESLNVSVAFGVALFRMLEA